MKVTDYLIFLIFLTAPISAFSQTKKSSGISTSANFRTANTSWDYNLGYTFQNEKHFITAGGVFVALRNIVLPPPYTIDKPLFPPSGFENLRYGLYAEYGIFPNKNPNQFLRSYFSVYTATKLYKIYEGPFNTFTIQNVWENEINIGYGFKLDVVKRIEFFSRFGFGVSYYKFNPAETDILPEASDVKSHFDIRFGMTYFLFQKP